jgi:hypothetical protein
MQPPDETRGYSERMIRDRGVELRRDISGQVREDLATAFVASDVTRHRIESVVVEVRQERAHELRVLPERTANCVPDANDTRCDATALERRFAHSAIG